MHVVLRSIEGSGAFFILLPQLRWGGVAAIRDGGVMVFRTASVSLAHITMSERDARGPEDDDS
jgi:hypothetical protein